MRRVYLSIFAFLIAGIVIGFAQNAGTTGTTGTAGTTDSKSKVVENNYSRSSLTVVLLNYDAKDPYAKDLKAAFEKLAIPQKYDDNTIDVKFVIPNFDMRTGNCAGSGAIATLFMGKEPKKMDDIKKLLTDAKAGHKIISKWFNKTPDGKFDMELVHKRGMYNATDAQFNDAKLTERGTTTEMKDAGKLLVNKSYILAIDFGNILTMEQWYDIKDNRRKILKQLGLDLGKKARTKEGFITDIKAYLFKLDGDNVQKVYDIWDEGAKFDALDFPMVPVTQIYYPRVEGTMLKGAGLAREVLFDRMAANAVEWSEFMLARKVEDFRVKAPVNDGNKGAFFPTVTSKVGKKEGLKVDTRYFVWENAEGKDGQKKSVRKGVIRVSNNIVDNREVTTGNTGTTKFYQVAGKKLEPGMLIQQRNDFQIGINVGAGFAPGDYEVSTSSSGSSSAMTMKYKSPLAITARLDYNISPYLAKIFTKWFTEMRVYGEARILGQADPAETTGTSTTTMALKSNMMFALGVSKDFHMMRNIKLSPFFQYAFGNSMEAGNSSISQMGFGARLPITLTHWMQLVPGLTIFTAPSSSAGTVYQDATLLSPMYIDAAIRVAF